MLSVGEGADINCGSPYLKNATVEAKILEQGKDKKVEVIKFKRRTLHKRTFGHRQHYVLVEITGIKLKKETVKKTTKEE